MKRLILFSLLLAGCSSTKREIRWSEASKNDPIWVCSPALKDPAVIECVSFGTVFAGILARLSDQQIDDIRLKAPRE